MVAQAISHDERQHRMCGVTRNSASAPSAKQAAIPDLPYSIVDRGKPRPKVRFPPAQELTRRCGECRHLYMTGVSLRRYSSRVERRNQIGRVLWRKWPFSMGGAQDIGSINPSHISGNFSRPTIDENRTFDTIQPCDILKARVIRMHKLSFTVHLFREGNTYVAHVPELDVSSCGETEEKARTNIKDAVRGFLEAAEHKGTLDEILEEAGYELSVANGRLRSLLALIA